MISNPDTLTEAVLAEAARVQDPRFRTLLTTAIKYLHGYVREVGLTEQEFHQICRVIAQLGQLSNDHHNEVVLVSGSLGISSLVCLLNNGDQGQTETTANLMGPFWRLDSPPTENGASIVRSPTPGDPIYVTATVVDQQGEPVAGAEVDVWHSDAEGFYENQDPEQADMNLRGKFTTDEAGRIQFKSIKPTGYPIPLSGPVGALLKAQGRHNMRPAHIHFMIYKPGFKTQFAQVYSHDDPNLETDVQFGVTQALVGQYVLHEGETTPDGQQPERWYALSHRFIIEPGEATLPKPPITGKATGPKPELAILKREAR